MKINTKEEAVKKLRSLEKFCLSASDKEVSEQPSSNESFYGGPFYGKDGEKWPVYEGRALIPWLFLSQKIFLIIVFLKM